MDYAADKAGIFKSDVHRRVLGHLSLPDADEAWSLPALVIRLAPDNDTPLPPRDDYGFADMGAGIEQLRPILDDLKADGYVKRHAGDLFQMTKKGFDALTGPIANPPKEGDPVTGPALITGPTKLGAKS